MGKLVGWDMASYTMTPPTILYIEDNHANRMLVKRVLDKLNYRLILAEDGETGMAMAIDEHPDLVLIDIGLPDVDGQTIGAMLRQMPGMEKIKLVAITAWPQDVVAQIAKRYQFDGYITKPIDLTLFPQQIAGFLAAKS